MSDTTRSWALDSLASEASEGSGLRIEGLQKAFDDEVVLEAVSFSVEPGEFCVVTGPSGCGKTTLLNCIAGIVEPDAGTVYLDGEDVGDRSIDERDLGYVFQEFDRVLFPHLTVRENIAFGLMLEGVEEEERNRRVDALAEIVAIGDLLDDYPSQLSGGQQQRVEFCRHLVRTPSVILFDDPFSNLDYKLKKKMETEVRQLSEQLGTTFVFVTHDQQMALELPDRLVLLNQGVIEQIGPPMEVYRNPESAFVAAYLGHSNLFFGRLTSILDEEVEIECDIGTFTVTIVPDRLDGLDLDEGDTVAFSVRPEKLSVGTAAEMEGYPNTARVRVAEVITQGNQIEYLLEDEAGDLMLRLGNEAEPRELPESAVAGWGKDVHFLGQPSKVEGWGWDDVREL